VLALLFDEVVVRSADRLFALGGPGTLSSLLAGVAGLQLLGFGTAAVLFLSSRERE
jgi:diacylglycerol kinase family enzyme